MFDEEGYLYFSIGDIGLAPGQSVKVYEIEKLNGTPIHVADGVVNDDATAIDVTSVGEGLHELTWIVVTE